MATLNREEVYEHLKHYSCGQGENFTLLPEEEKKTVIEEFKAGGEKIPVFINEFWTSRQRQASSLQEVSYRACFKPQLPRFFIELLTAKGDKVYDPFSGRGTTVVEAGLLGRQVISNDINPLSRILSQPRFSVPTLPGIARRLSEIPLNKDLKADFDLSMFFYPDTEGEIVSLQRYLQARKEEGLEDHRDSWIRMVATNRLTGHSPGFFSVYTLPPNQAVSPQRQAKINEKRKQVPPYRDTVKIIMKKTRNLVKNLSPGEVENLKKAASTAWFLEKDAGETWEIPGDSVQLTVTSPPFLDVVQYSKDNWLRCWFNGIDTKEVEKKITMARTMEEWSSVMGKAFRELYRITCAGGWVAFEVGEVRKGTINLEDYVVPLGLKAGFTCRGILINLQEFTKTSNIWGVNNNSFGTNTNRIVLFCKD